MTKMTRRGFAAAVSALVGSASAWAQRRRRRVVVTPRRRTRTRVVVRPGYPVRRARNRTVIVRPPRKTVVVGAPLVFLPVIAFSAPVVVLPARERLKWQDTETIERDENWVESNFGVDERGSALYIQIDGRADLDTADVTFENGEVQVVDFNERTYGQGIRRLLDFPGQRNVKTVRLVARSKTEHTTLRLYLST